MEQKTSGLTFDESIKQVMQTLPPVIRNYLVQEGYIPVIRKLIVKYTLRIDQGSVLEREIMLLLMGVETPDEFMQALVDDARLDKNTANEIVRDVNDQIFIPLRKEEEVGGGGVKPVIEAPKPIVRVERPLAPHIAPLPPKMAMPGQISSARQFGNGKTLLEDHEEPHIEFAAVPEVKKEVFPPKVEVSPENLPGAMPPIMPTTEEGAETPVSPVRKLDSFTPPIRTGSVDPYREPLDEPLR